jgi:glycosyltransferase involved in cell wall biosynthesis
VDAFREAGGEEEVAFYIYNSLPRSEYDVTLAGPKDSPYFQKKLPKQSEFLNVSLSGKFDFLSMLKIRKYVKESNVDIVNVHGYIAGYIVRIACCGLKTKVVWTMHVNVLDVPSIGKVKRIIRSKIEGELNRFLTNEVVCVAEELKHVVEKQRIRTPISVVYNGIDVSAFSDTHKKTSFYVRRDNELVLGFVSRLSTQKGINYLLKLAVVLREEKVNYKMLIVGDGDQKSFIESYIKKNQLEKNVTLYGFQKDVNNVLDSIDVLLLPSLFEGFPMIILEALCSKTPVIASNVNGIPEVVKDNENGFLVTPRDVSALYRAVLKYVQRPELIKIHGEKGHQTVIENYSKDMMLSQYEKIFSSLVDVK